MSEYKTLVASGYPITWTTLLIGWEADLVTTEELQWYAADRLGKQEGPVADWIFGVFDADTSCRCDVRRHLERLAEAEPGDPEANRLCIRRTWNVAVLRRLFEWCEQDVRLPPTHDDIYDEVIDLTWVAENAPFPSAFASPPDAETRNCLIWFVPPDVYEERYRQALHVLESWIAEESRALDAMLFAD